MIGTTISIADAVQIVGDSHQQRLGRLNRLPNLFSVLVEAGSDAESTFMRSVAAIEAIQLTLPSATLLDLKDKSPMEIGNALGQSEPGILIVDWNDPAFTPSQKALFLQILIDARYANANFTLNMSNTLVIVQTNYRGMMMPGPIINRTFVLDVGF